jgi:hypothetical protein
LNQIIKSYADQDLKGGTMFKRIVLFTSFFCLSGLISVFAGVEWQAKITDQIKGKEKISLTHAYAQGGSVRQEFVEVKSNDNPFMKKEVYWLYKGDSDKIYVVNTKEKTYMEVPMQAMLQVAGSLGQIVKMTITEPKVEVAPLNKETVSGYDCDHLQVTTSYKMETKIAFMKIQNAIEQTQVLWATKAVDRKSVV